jgi:RNA polymerase sigma factor (sigma-70 family)
VTMGGPPTSGASLAAILPTLLPVLRAYVRLNVNAELRAYESSSDIVQSLCREILAAAGTPSVAEPDALRGWIWVVVRNKVRDRLRYLHRQRRDCRREVPLAEEGDREATGLYSRMATPSQCAQAHEFASRFEGALASMSRDDRELVTLSRVVGLSNREIAKHLGITPANVSMRIHRALLRFAEQWRKVEQGR